MNQALIAAACEGVAQLYQPGVRYAKAGVMLFDLVPVAGMQMGLFDQGDSEKSQLLMATVDRLNRLYGRRSLFFGREGTCQGWAMKRDRMTPCYTTRWDEIPVVRG